VAAVPPLQLLTPPVGTPDRSPLPDLQRAIMPALFEEFDGVCGVYDYVPEDAVGPYIVWNTGWLAPRFTLRSPGHRVWFQIDVWSGPDHRGYLEVGTLADRVISRVSWAFAVMDGYDTAQIYAEQEHYTRDNQGNRRVAITFHSPFVIPLPPP
jgi:hypothetical protein